MFEARLESATSAANTYSKDIPKKQELFSKQYNWRSEVYVLLLKKFKVEIELRKMRTIGASLNSKEMVFWSFDKALNSVDHESFMGHFQGLSREDGSIHTACTGWQENNGPLHSNEIRALF